MPRIQVGVGDQSGVQPCIIPGLPMHSVQELNVGTVSYLRVADVLPQPVIAQSKVSEKAVVAAGMQIGEISLLNVTGDESLSRAMSESTVLGFQLGWTMSRLTEMVLWEPSVAARLWSPKETVQPDIPGFLITINKWHGQVKMNTNNYCCSRHMHLSKNDFKNVVTIN